MPKPSAPAARQPAEPTPAATFALATYQEPAPVTLTLRRPAGQTGPIWLWGDFLGSNEIIARLAPDASDPTLYTYMTTTRPDTTIKFQVFDRRPFDHGLLGDGKLVEAHVPTDGLNASYTVGDRWAVGTRRLSPGRRRRSPTPPGKPFSAGCRSPIRFGPATPRHTIWDCHRCTDASGTLALGPRQNAR